MQHDGVGFGAAQALGAELVEQNIMVWGEGGLVEPLGLHAQHEDDVGALERLFDLKDAANRAAGFKLFELARNPHGGTAQREAAAKFAEQMNVGAGHAAVLDIAEDSNVQFRDGSLAKLNITILGDIQHNPDRKSTRLNSSHQIISYSVFFL